MSILLDMTQEVVNITTSEVAQLARVDTSTVRRWVERGLLKPAMKLPGGHYRFDRSVVTALLNPTSAVSPEVADHKEAPAESASPADSVGASSRSAA